MKMINDFLFIIFRIVLNFVISILYCVFKRKSYPLHINELACEKKP